MLLHWYAYIFMNTYLYEIYHISLKTIWWALFNTSLIVQIHLAIHEISANKTFTVTDGVVVTTRHSRTNDLTTSKALQWAIK